MSYQMPPQPPSQFTPPAATRLPPSYQQGFPQQQPQPYQPASQQQQQEMQNQLVKFYKSGAFSSAVGRMQRDIQPMQTQGWRLQHTANLGTNVFMRRFIVAVWVR